MNNTLTTQEERCLKSKEDFYSKVFELFIEYNINDELLENITFNYVNQYNYVNQKNRVQSDVYKIEYLSIQFGTQLTDEYRELFKAINRVRYDISYSEGNQGFINQLDELLFIYDNIDIEVTRLFKHYYRTNIPTKELLEKNFRSDYLIYRRNKNISKL